MSLVADASIVVAALVDDGPTGRWAETALGSGPLAAPHLLLVESANIVRRAVLHGQVAEEVGSLAHADLLRLPVELFDYEPFGERCWQLRANVTTYDAWYVALAETLTVPLATLDHRLARATGPRCEFHTPPDP